MSRIAIFVSALLLFGAGCLAILAWDRFGVTIRSYGAVFPLHEMLYLAIGGLAGLCLLSFRNKS